MSDSEIVKIGRVIDLIAEPASDYTFQLGLEKIEAGTGRLLEFSDATYAGTGVGFCAGDVLFGKLRPYLAKSWLADRSGAAVGDFHVYRPMPTRLDSRYFTYCTLSSSFLSEVASSVYGSKMPRANWSFVRNIEVHLPSLQLQRAIADYLDLETQRIDELIAEQRGLIETLRERRRSVVDGLLFSYGMALNEIDLPSEIELPHGWEIMMLGSALEKLTNGYVGPTRDILVEEGVRYIQGTHIKNGAIDFERRPFFVAQDWHDSRPRINLRAGDVLIVQTGDIGKVAVVPDGFGEASCHALQIARARTSVIDPWYLGAYLGSWYGYNQLKSRATGALHPHLEAGVRSSLLVVPPLPVQKEIVRSASSQTSRIDALIGESEDLITLSQERRAALITAAVTGQIDVRTAT